MARPDVALTGTLTPDGAILPVPTARDKARAAHGAARLVAPVGNQADLKGAGGFEIVFVSRLDEALKASLAKRVFKRGPSST